MITKINDFVNIQIYFNLSLDSIQNCMIFNYNSKIFLNSLNFVKSVTLII